MYQYNLLCVHLCRNCPIATIVYYQDSGSVWATVHVFGVACVDCFDSRYTKLRIPTAIVNSGRIMPTRVLMSSNMRVML